MRSPCAWSRTCSIPSRRSSTSACRSNSTSSTYHPSSPSRFSRNALGERARAPSASTECQFSPRFGVREVAPALGSVDFLQRAPPSTCSGHASRRRQEEAAPQGERFFFYFQKRISAHPEEVPSFGTVSK